MKGKKQNKLKFRWPVFLAVVFSILILLGGGFYYYVSDYYHASESVLELIATDQRIIEQSDSIIFLPEPSKDKEMGLVFYPGGKVEAKAYGRLLKQLSDIGIGCYLVKMPFNLAVFDISAFERIRNQHSEIKQWYLAGHSLGGAMASTYLGKQQHQELVRGLILLAAYPVNQAPVKTLVLYGQYDRVLDLTKLEKVSPKIMIAGGNHAYFGDYGEQAKDGQATISRQHQQQKTVQIIQDFIMEHQSK